MAGSHRRYRGRHRAPRPPLRPRLIVAAEASAAAAVAIAAVFGAPALIVAATDGPRPVPSLPADGAAAPPLPAPATPPTPAPEPVVPPAALADPPPEVSCADFPTAAAALQALRADPDLAPLLDTDGDGRPCELRFAPAVAPQTTPRTPAPQPAPDRGDACPSSGFSGVQPHVARAGHHLAQRFDVSLGSVLGVGSRARASYHPSGRALDFMVDRATGDELAAYVLAHLEELAVIEVIWLQRINFGDGWEPMADRGSDTANHLDHVHLSFAAGAPDVDITC